MLSVWFFWSLQMKPWAERGLGGVGVGVGGGSL